MAIYNAGTSPKFPGVPPAIASLQKHDENLNRGAGWSDPYDRTSERHNLVGLAADLRSRVGMR